MAVYEVFVPKLSPSSHERLQTINTGSTLQASTTLRYKFADETVNFEGLETGLKELFKKSTADLLIFASASR